MINLMKKGILANVRAAEEEAKEAPLKPINQKHLKLYDEVPEIDLYFADEYKLKHPAKKVTEGLSGELLEKLHGVSTWDQ